MTASVCPFCHLASGAPHPAQQACIDALQKEIAHTRQALMRRPEPWHATSVGTHVRQHRYHTGAEGRVDGAPRLSLRCVLET